MPMKSALNIGKRIMDMAASTGPNGESSKRSNVPATSSPRRLSASVRPECRTEMITSPMATNLK
jgi:hypothetical protein